ncbi:MAG: S1-like domain-containing RNA-binding protein [Segetibacter sp.]
MVVKVFCCRRDLCRRTCHTGEEIKVFVYHDSEGRLIATTQQPKGVVGEIVKLKAVTITNQELSLTGD